jgi:hypothetical protein
MIMKASEYFTHFLGREGIASKKKLNPTPTRIKSKGAFDAETRISSKVWRVRSAFLPRYRIRIGTVIKTKAIQVK